MPFQGRCGLAGLNATYFRLRIDCGADPLVRGRRPRRPVAFRVADFSAAQRDEGVPRGPGGPPYNMKILLTGGAGFIGSHLAERLASEGHQLSIVDDLNDFYSPDL